jgi:NADPH-dependent curcumin reductase CurA
MPANRRIVLASRPVGVPRPENFAMVEAAIPEPGPGGILVRNLYLAMEPAIRGWLDDRESYVPPIPIGGTIGGPVLGRVIRSHDPGFTAGDLVQGFGGWEEYSVLGDLLRPQRIEPVPGVPLSTHLGALGGSGLTAYIGLHEVGRLAPGETVVVSAAAGAVGSVAGQIARLSGCRSIGIVGSATKASIITERLGYDAAINRSETPDLSAAVRSLCPDGVDLYFDNVGGSILDGMLPCMKDFGRIVVCGMIADYNRRESPTPIHNLWQTVVHRLTLRGFLLPDHADAIPGATAALRSWIGHLELVPIENISHGLEAAPEAFVRLLSGATAGKTLIELGPAD